MKRNVVVNGTAYAWPIMDCELYCSFDRYWCSRIHVDDIAEYDLKFAFKWIREKWESQVLYRKYATPTVKAMSNVDDQYNYVVIREYYEIQTTMIIDGYSFHPAPYFPRDLGLDM